MKRIFKIFLFSVLVLGIVYFLFSIYAGSFSFMAWDQGTRIGYAITGGILEFLILQSD